MNFPRNSMSSGALYLFASTALAGVLGYIIIISLARFLSASYAEFAIYWSALYFVIGSLSGIQQETTRATIVRKSPANSLKKISLTVLLIAISISGFIFATSPIWSVSVFSSNAYVYGLAIAISSFFWILLSSLVGVFYGAKSWKLLSFFIIGDVVLRALFIGTTELLNYSVEEFAWAVILPFPILFFIAFLFFNKSYKDHIFIDVTNQVFIANVSKTLLASISMSVIISGFPLLLGLFSSQVSAQALSSIIFAVILTRAPLVMLSLSFQSYFVVFFKSREKNSQRTLVALLVIVFGVGLLLGILAYYLANTFIVAFAGEAYSLDPIFLGLITLTSASTAALIISGAHVLSKSLHSIYAFGWVVAAFSVVLMMFLPINLQEKAILVLGVGPLIGLLVHVFGEKMNSLFFLRNFKLK